MTATTADAEKLHSYDGQDLHELVDSYSHSRPEDVLRIDDEISPDEEITAVVDELAGRGLFPLLYFTNVRGLGVPVITNMFASRERISRLLGTTLDELHAVFDRKSNELVAPVVVDDGPVLANTASGADVDLTTLPLVTHFTTDKAPYITSGVIIVEGEDGAPGNMSYHRAMVHSPTTLATSLHSRGHLWRRYEEARERNDTLRMAMVMGGHPLFMLAASARVSADIDERRVAGGLMGAPLELVRTPRYGIGVPASSDFVLEGTIRVDERVDEGPFGEFTGYSSDRSTHTLVEIDTILWRDSPVLLDVVGGNSAEHLNLSRIPRESEMSQKLKARFPSVVALHYPNSGTHFHCYVSLRQRRPGEARQVILGLLGWDPYLKTVIAVDDDVDITDDRDVLWAMATRFQPARDIVLIDGLPGSALDPSSSSEGTTSRVGFDATRGEGFDSTRIDISDEARHRARAILSDL